MLLYRRKACHSGQQRYRKVIAATEILLQNLMLGLVWKWQKYKTKDS